MRTLPGVGNDVVDLKEPENCGKCGDHRFVARVFTAEERTQIAGAGPSDRLLWSFWAAKEAAYKAVSREDPGVCSIPRRYRVLLDGDPLSAAGLDAGGSQGCLAGRVITPVGEVALRIAVTEDYVHALVAESAAGLARVVSRVDQAGAAEPGSDPSTFVRRQLLREMARFLECPIEELAIRKEPSGSGAPSAFLRGQPLAAEISLSHDGRFAAFALRFAPP
jgi:hypothetical protein